MFPRFRGNWNIEIIGGALLKRVLSLMLCVIMCFSVFNCAIVEASAVGVADRIFSVKSEAIKNGQITYTVTLTGGVENFGGAVILIEYDNNVLAPAEEGFKPALRNTGTQVFEGIYEAGVSADNENIYCVGYTNVNPETKTSDTEFFSITFDVISEERPTTELSFYCKEFLSTSDADNSITVDDGLQLIARITDVVTLEVPKLVGAVLTTNAIIVEWEASVGATSYEIRRKPIDGTWKTVATVSASELKYNDNDIALESGNTYVYTVRALNSWGLSMYDSTGVSCKYISKPENVKAVNNVNGIDISWSVTRGADGYVIMRRESGSQKWSVLTRLSSASVNTFKDTTAVSGKTYEYDVDSTLGNFITQTRDQGEVVSYLASPSDITVSNINEGIEIKWNLVENATHYIVYRRTLGGSQAELSEYALAVSNTFVDADVDARVGYVYSVKAVGNDGESAFNTKGYTIIRVPSTAITQIVPTVESVAVYFGNIDGVDSYTIYRRTADSSWEKIGTASKIENIFEDKSAISGKEYFYGIAAVIGNSESPITPYDNGFYYLKTPQNVKAYNTKDDITVTWDACESANGYYVFRKTGETGKLTLVGAVNEKDVLLFNDTKVSDGEVYCYVIQAYNDKSLSLQSELSAATMRIACVTDVTAEITQEGLLVSWNSHNVADSYILCLNKDGEWLSVGETEDRKYSFTDVKSGESYVFSVIPVVGEYQGGIDETAVCEIVYVGSPVVKKATNYKATVKVEWSGVAGAEKYLLQRVKVASDGENSGSYETIATLDGDALSYKDKDISSGITYRYRTFAIIGDQQSAVSESFTHTFLSVPKISSFSNAYGGVEIGWKKVKNADKYVVMRKEGSGDWKTIKTVSSSVSVYIDKTAKSKVEYDYAVKAIKGESESNYEAKSFTYFGSPKATVSNNTSAITVKWEKIDGAKSYYVYRKGSGDKSWKQVAVVTKNIYTDKNVKNGKTYKYTVKAYNGKIFSGYNKSGWSIKRLTVPKLNKISNKTSGVYLSWSKVTGASSYIVYRKTSTTSWEEIGKTKTALSFTDKTVKSGKYYTYTVVAKSGSSESTYVADGIKTKYLSRPSLVSVKSAKKGITFTWKEVTGASGYYVYRKTGSGEWEQLAKVSGKSNVSYVDATAKKGKTYYYSVRAYSGSHKSAYNTKGLKIKDKY